MEQNYQLELKHLAPRVYAAVLHKEGLKSAGCVLFMDCTGLTTKERLNWRKESFFLETPPLPEQERASVNGKESEQSQGLLPEPC